MSEKSAEQYADSVRVPPDVKGTLAAETENDSRMAEAITDTIDLLQILP